MDLILTCIILGFTTGLIYAIAGVGLVVVYRTSGYVSFAQGDVAAVALYVGFFAFTAGMPYLMVAAVVLLVGGALGGALAATVVSSMEKKGHLVGALATIGVGLTLQGLEVLTVGELPKSFPSIGTDTLLQVGPVGLSVSDFAALVTAIALFFLLGLLFTRTRVGLAMRAANDNSVAATHVGVPIRRLRIFSWVISGILAGVCGLFVAPLNSLTPFSVNAILVFGFATVVSGGFDSIAGSLISGVAIGVTSNLVALLLSPQLVTTSVFILLLAVLAFRPNGLLGRRPVVRV